MYDSVYFSLVIESNCLWYSLILACAVPSINKMAMSIAIVVILIARHVGVLINSITNAATMIKIGITLNTTLYSFKVLSARLISD